jgi:choice-of-anchor B domain-containing protein
MTQRSLLLLLLLFPAYLFSQFDFNLEKVSNLNYPQNCNDVWAWVAPDGTEYAILGTVTGTAIISLADPANPVEVQFIPGANSTWRDMKHWGDFVYVTADVGSDGLLVIDMSGAPDSITWKFWKPSITANNATDTLRRCHNLYIDEFGYAYLAGCNLNRGGPLFIDVHSTPGDPIYVGASDPRYSHDVYVRNNLMYSSDINDGFFSIVDVADKSAAQTIAVQNTSFRFTHNAWLSDNSQYVFTTDERPSAFIDAFDVSNPDNIIFTDRYRPLATEGQGVIPHNVHVIDDYLVISYYTDGVKVVDASDPYNLIEVGGYDTYLPAAGGFNGCWGAYPWLPSGLVLASDINTGLYVLRPTYVRAARLEGRIIDAVTGNGLNNAQVVIQSEQIARTNSASGGGYKTGLAFSGTYDVTVQRTGYKTTTVTVDLQNGEKTILDIPMDPEPRFNLQAQVIDAQSGGPIANAQIEIKGLKGTEVITTNENGTAQLSALEDEYQVIAGAWGYGYDQQNIGTLNNDRSFTFQLEPGYTDHFVFDYGWEVTGEAPSGAWERGVPEATFLGNEISNPNGAFPQALGNKCYVTGAAAGGAVGANDLDDGITILTSPLLDLSAYENPVLQYARWFYNAGGFGTPNDTLKAFLLNEDGQFLLEAVWGKTNGWKLSPEFVLKQAADMTKPFQLVFIASDLPGTGHIVEAAIDYVTITDSPSTSTTDLHSINDIQIYPNPVYQNEFVVHSEKWRNEDLEIMITDLRGAILYRYQAHAVSGRTVIRPQNLTSGIYLVTIKDQSNIPQTNKIIFH